MQLLEIPLYGIRIQTDLQGAGSLLESHLFNHLVDKDDSSLDNAAIRILTDGIESLILAQACEGIDITTPAYVTALTTALDAVIEYHF